MSKMFKSNAFIFRQSAISEALTGVVEGSKPFFLKEPKAMVIHADGKRQVLDSVTDTPPAVRTLVPAFKPLLLA